MFNDLKPEESKTADMWLGPDDKVPTLATLRKILHVLPHLDSSDETYEADVMAAADSQPAIPEALKSHGIET